MNAKIINTLEEYFKLSGYPALFNEGTSPRYFTINRKWQSTSSADEGIQGDPEKVPPMGQGGGTNR